MIRSHPGTMPLTPGARLGAYEIVGLLGSGGMGEVYRASDTRLKRQVAIKILPEAVGRDPDRLARFHREAELLASLNHPNIAAIYGFEDSAAIHGLVMEVIDGPTLADRIDKGPVPLAEAIAIAKQIGDALQAAHAQHVIHRDLKPANIKVKPDGAVKVLDFGLAKALDPRGPSADGLSATLSSPAVMTGHGVILGTAAYMSPEQARGQAVDQRTDIWAFGVILYEMLTGARPFGGATVSDTIVSVLDREPDWSALPASTPAAVTRVLRQCLQKDARQRRRDIGDIQIDLQDSLQSGQLASAAAGVRAAHSRMPFALMFGALALVVVGAIAGSVMYARRAAANTNAPDPIELSVFPPPGTVWPIELGAPWPSISPDGRQLAFVAVDASGLQHLWIRQLDSASPRIVDHTEGAARPFWSPDGRAIGFFADGKIKRVDLPNGAAQVVCDAPYLGGMSASWGSQGTIVFVENGGPFRVPASGGTPQLIATDSVGARGWQNPSFLPDGRRFLFVDRRPKREDDQLCVSSIDAPAPQCFATLASPARYADPGYLLYVRDGVLRLQPFAADRLALTGESTPVSSSFVSVDPVYRPPPFSISARALAYHPGTAKSRLAWIDRKGRIASVIGDAEEAGAALSRDGSRMMVNRRDPQHVGDVELWLRVSSVQTWSRFTFGPNDTSPVFSPDGMRVVYASQREGSSRLMVKSTNGLEAERQLLQFPPGQDGSPQDWSTDGRWIVYGTIGGGTNWDIGMIPADGSGPPQLLLHSPAGERAGKLSPDMKWIAYDSTESGRREIWLQPMPPAPSGNRWQVSNGGGFAPQWRGDGRELFYLAADGKMMAVAITPGPTPIIGASTPLFQTLRREGASGFQVSRDGSQFLLSGPPDLADTDPITVIVNWARTSRGGN
jgi:hypothetical protein